MQNVARPVDASTKAPESQTVPPYAGTPEGRIREGWEEQVLGAERYPDARPNFSFDGYTNGGMLCAALSPDISSEIIYGGLVHAADTLSVIEFATMREYDTPSIAITSGVLRGIEQRLRILAQIMRRSTSHNDRVDEKDRDATNAKLDQVFELVASAVQTHPDIEARVSLRMALSELERMKEG